MMRITQRLQKRLRNEESGFTLIELLIVLVIIGVLLAIAVPSYLGFKQRAEKKAAQSNVRSTIPAVEAFYSDNGTYVGSSLAVLQGSYDAGLSDNITLSGQSSTAYTITYDSNGSASGGCTSTFSGPGNTDSITTGGDCP